MLQRENFAPLAQPKLILQPMVVYINNILKDLVTSKSVNIETYMFSLTLGAKT
jgi:hypothetical protein